MNRKTKKTKTTEQTLLAQVWTYNNPQTISKLVFQEKMLCAPLFSSLAFTPPIPPTFHTLVSQ